MTTENTTDKESKTNNNTHLYVKFEFADATYSVKKIHVSEDMAEFYANYGHARIYVLPSNTDTLKFDAWMAEDVQPILDRIKAGYENHWDGVSSIARFDEDALNANDELESLLAFNDNKVPVLDGNPCYVYADDWFFDIKTETLSKYAISVASTDSDLDFAAAKIDASVLPVKLYDTRHWLDLHRDRMIKEGKDK